MKIGLDASWAGRGGTGTASYTRGLARALAEHREHELVLYMESRGSDGCMVDLSALPVEVRLVDGFGQIGRSLVSLSRACARDGLDVFHSPAYFLPLWRGPKVVTFHDANMFVYWRKWWEQGERLRWLSLCAQSLLSSRTATAIVADSQYAAASIARALRLPPQKITVIYPGVDARFFAPIQADAARAIREQHALDRYLLFVSVITPHKNLDTVLRAYAMARPRDTKLAVAGKEYGSHLRDVIRPLLRDLEIDRDVEILGMVPDESLPALYAGAEGLLHVSHTEGFGLPPLEAMACGTPVIASNGTSLPEVLDAAALLVDPNDLRAIAEAIDRLTSDAPLRQKLIACGRRRAARFCWSDAADQMLALYASVI